MEAGRPVRCHRLVEHRPPLLVPDGRVGPCPQQRRHRAGVGVLTGDVQRGVAEPVRGVGRHAGLAAEHCQLRGPPALSSQPHLRPGTRQSSAVMSWGRGASHHGACADGVGAPASPRRRRSRGGSRCRWRTPRAACCPPGLGLYEKRRAILGFCISHSSRPRSRIGGDDRDASTAVSCAVCRLYSGTTWDHACSSLGDGRGAEQVELQLECVSGDGQLEAVAAPTHSAQRPGLPVPTGAAPCPGRRCGPAPRTGSS